MASVTFIDSSGLGALSRLRVLAAARGGDVVLVSPAASVVRLLAIVGFDATFTIQA